MKAVKKIEIVVNSLELDTFIASLEKIGIRQYTILPNAQGAGNQGRQRDDDVTGCSQNSYLFTTCSAEEVPKLIEKIRPFLKRHHGVCLVSDAEWVIH